MMLWFLLRDQRAIGGWQSGLLTLGGNEEAASRRSSTSGADAR